MKNQSEPCFWARRAPNGIWFYVTPEQAKLFQSEPGFEVKMATQTEMLAEVDRLTKEVTMPIK